MPPSSELDSIALRPLVPACYVGAPGEVFPGARIQEPPILNPGACQEQRPGTFTFQVYPVEVVGPDEVEPERLEFPASDRDGLSAQGGLPTSQ